jgi:predicted transcriptional regulator
MARKGRENSDDAVILALASGRTVRETSDETLVSQRTIFRRLGDPEFVRRVNEARAEMFSQAVGRLAAITGKAATRLEELFQSESDSVALGACRAVLELGAKLRETVELEQRIAELERRSEQKQPTLDAA